MSDIEIRPLDAVSEHDILDLLRLSLGAEELRTPEYWRWKHRDNPFGASPGLVAVDSGGRPVALRVFLRWQLESSGRVLRAARAVDTATHPDWRRRGLFRRLTLAMVDRLREEGTDLIFNTPNPQSLQGYLGMGWSEVGRLPILVKPARVVRLAYRRLRGGGTSSLDPDGLEACSARLGEAPLAELAESSRDEPRLHTRRTSAYLRWRYELMPAFRYGALAASREASRALVVFRLRLRGGARELSVSDLLMGGPNGGSLAAGLCREALERTGADYAAATAAGGTPERQCLRQAGFVPAPLPRRPILVTRTLQPKPMAPDPRAWSSWRVSTGDLELL